MLSTTINGQMTNKIRLVKKQTRKKDLRHKNWLVILGLIPLMTIAVGQNSKLGQTPPIVVFIFFWVISYLGTKGKNWNIRLPKPLLIMLMAWLSVAIFSMALNYEGYKFVFGRIAFIILVLFAYGCFETPNDMDFFERIYLISLAILAILTLLNAYHIVHLPFMDRISGRKMWSFLPNRTQGIFMSYGEHGILYSLGFAFIFKGLFTKSSKIYVQPFKSYQYKILFFLLFWELMILQSRNIYLGFTVMLIVFICIGLNSNSLKNSSKLLLSFLLVLLTVIAIYLGAKIVNEMYKTNVGSFDIRMNVNRAAIDLILQNPLIGIGYGYTHELFVDILGGKASGLHNAFLFEFLSVGVIFGSFYIFIFIYLIKKLFSFIYDKANSLYIRSISIGLLAGISFVVVELNGFLGFFVEIFAVMIALIARLSLWRKYHLPT